MRRKKDETPKNEPKPPKGASRSKRRPVAAPAMALAAGMGGEALAADVEPLVVSEPADGARKLLQTRVTFRGTATAPVVEVRAFASDVPNADPLFIQSVNAQGRWEHDREFTQKGDRPIRVEGLDENGDVVATVKLKIHLFAGLEGYRPPTAALGVLGNIVGLLESAKNIRPDEDFVGGDHLFRLPGGACYMVSDLDVDTDGSPSDQGDHNFLDMTSLSKKKGQDVPVNAVTEPYFALNPHIAEICGLKLGDVAAVIFKGRLAFAIYADNNGRPSNRGQWKVGEGSLALHEALGHHVTNPNTQGLDAGTVITIMFPKTHASNGTGYLEPDAVVAAAKSAFNKLAKG